MKNGLKVNGNSIRLGLDVLLYKEGEYSVLYCPSLDLSAYAKTKREVEKSFSEMLDIFLEETIEKGTLEKVLINLGWTLSKNDYRPPVIPHLTDLLVDKLSGTIETKQISIPLAS